MNFAKLVKCTSKDFHVSHYSPSALSTGLIRGFHCDSHTIAHLHFPQQCKLETQYAVL
jgi:hypothetical protein